MLRGRLVTAQPPTWPTKDPSETLDYTADFTSVLPLGAVPLQLDYAVLPAGALAISASFTGSIVSLVVSGGAAGTTPQIALTLTTADGQQITRSVFLPILSLGPVAPVDPEALTVNDFALTTDGDPLTA